MQAITGDAATWLAPLRSAAITHEINTNKRVKMFLAQCAHESAGFTRLVENLKYSAAALRRTWPHRFSEADAQDMQYDEYRIGERAYGGRMGNRAEGSGDGFVFRGRGIIQITGRSNYFDCGAALGASLTDRPELLERPQFAAWSAGWFWKIHGCNELADDDDFAGITRAINGGMNGYGERVAWLSKAEEAA